MRKLWVIAHREYVAMVGTKAFLFSLIMMPILMFGSILVMPLIQRVSSGKTYKIVVADGTGKLFTAIEKAANARNATVKESAKPSTENGDLSDSSSNEKAKSSREAARESIMGQASDLWEFTQYDGIVDDAKRLELSDRLRTGELYAFIELPSNMFAQEQPSQDSLATDGNNIELSKAKFYSQDALISEIRGWTTAIIQQQLRVARLQQYGLGDIDPKVFARIDAPVELSPSMPMLASDQGKKDDSSTMDSLIAMFLPFGVMMLMFMVILMAAQPMLESAMEEKSLRISELLLGSVTPAQLMGGKLLGNVGGSLVIFILYGAGGWFFLNAQGLSDKLPTQLIPWFLLFQLLGVLFFSSIFLTVGASVNELKEAQTMLLPVWMVLMAPMMVWFVAVREPNGIVATSLSFFPPSCPMMMVLRLASGTTVPVWQPPAAAVMMMVVTYLIVRTAGHIYRAGLLRNEGVRSFTQLFRRSFHS
jgi:ABC-2 type transport system permease protein